MMEFFWYWQAQFLLGRGRLEEAESAFSAAVGVARRVHGDQGEQTLVIQNSLATVLRKTVVRLTLFL